MEITPEEEDIILPEGWDGESDFLADYRNETEETPTTETEAEETEQVEQPQDSQAQEQPATEEVVAEVQEVETVETDNEIVQATQPKLKVTYNHKEQELDMEQARRYAQMGMNYERLDPTITEATKLAKDMGYGSMKEMIEAARANFINNKVQELVDDGVHEVIAKKIVEDNIRESEAKARAEEAAAEAEARRVAEEQLIAQRNAEIEMFVKAFPGVTVLPESVKQANAKGVPLVAAYAQYVANQRQVELQKIKQQQETASRAPVGGATKFGGVGQQAKDPFEEGFDEDSW